MVGVELNIVHFITCHLQIRLILTIKSVLIVIYTNF